MMVASQWSDETCVEPRGSDTACDIRADYCTDMRPIGAKIRRKRG